MTQEEYRAEFDILVEHIIRMKELGERGVYVDWFVEKDVSETYERIKELNNSVIR